MNKKNLAPIGNETLNTNTDINTKTKQFTILSRLANGLPLTSKEARSMGEFDLRTTISKLQRSYRITILRRYIEVKNRFSGTSRCCEYWLEGRDLEHIKKIVRKCLVSNRSEM